MKKRSIVLFMALTMAFTTCSCSKKEEVKTSTQEIVTATAERPAESKEEAKLPETEVADTEAMSEKETEKVTEKPTEKPSVKESEKSAKDKDEVTPEFKKAMDDYEQFFDEYVAFMKKYTESDNPLSMMKDYAEMLVKYEKYMKEFDDIDESTLSEADQLYFIKVQNRINEKLLEVVQ